MWSFYKIYLFIYVFFCYRLLVGAPREKAEPKLEVNRTGDLYACPITTNPKDCIRANLISSGNVRAPRAKHHAKSVKDVATVAAKQMSTHFSFKILILVCFQLLSEAHQIKYISATKIHIQCEII